MAEGYWDEKGFVVALADNRLDDAKRLVLDGIIWAKQQNVPPVLCALVQKLGTVLARQDDRITALVCYELSEQLDHSSLLAKLEYAKFLAAEQQDVSGALAKCSEIIRDAREDPFPRSDNDFGSEDYAAAATRLIAEIRGSESGPLN